MPDQVLGRVVQTPIDRPIVVPTTMYGQIVFASDELQCNCPVTGQPDMYDVVIGLDAQGKTLESKSLKLYLWKFRSLKMFAEDLCQTIFNELLEELKDSLIFVELHQKSRGGIRIGARVGTE